jgi:hypothetical protein
MLLITSSLLGAFPVVTFVEMMLSSVENCFLIGSLTRGGGGGGGGKSGDRDDVDAHD